MTATAPLPRITTCGIEMVDLRSVLPKRDWIIGTRPHTDSVTHHWNGPAVPEARQRGAGVIEQLIIDARWQMRPGWGGTTNGAPHLMYHIVIDADGVVYLCCDIDEMVWHCAHQDGNTNGVAIHLPVGTDRSGEQALTPAQHAALIRVTEALRAAYRIARSRVFGHIEWLNATDCPGQLMMAQLRAYRAGQTPAPKPIVLPVGVRRFQITPELTLPARVRQDYATPNATIAGRLKPGTIIYVDTINTGVAVDGDRRWVHLARVPNMQADLGFISMTLVRELDQVTA